MEVYLQLHSTSKLPLKTPCCTCYITYKGGLYHYKMCYLCHNMSCRVFVFHVKPTFPIYRIDKYSEKRHGSFAF